MSSHVTGAPKVSVCIPAYNSPGHFSKALESVLVQEYPEFEVVVTDDSPGDCVREVVERTTSPVPLIYRKNEVRLGAPGNWNRALSLASGDYLKILHHDDWLLTPQSLARFVDLMERTPEAGLGFSATEAYDDGRLLKFLHAPSRESVDGIGRDPQSLLLANLIGPPSSVIFRNSPGLRFDENLRWLVDVEFYLRLLEGRALAYCEEPLVGATVEGAHQVTRECENNRQVELYEHLYLFSRLSRRRGIVPYLRLFSQLFKKHGVRSPRELDEVAPGVAVPWYLKLLARLPRR